MDPQRRRGGARAEIESDELHNAAVADCLLTQVKTWVFPKPKGGGLVIVSYPFVFKRAG